MSGGPLGGPDVDPTHGHIRPVRFKGQKEGIALEDKLPLGYINDKEYDEKYGRWWHENNIEERPRLYSTIGRHARSPHLHRRIILWARSTPNWKRLLRDVYRKRWPTAPLVSVAFFAEFCHKSFEKRTLLETANTLPLRGVGCKFWRGKTPDCPDTRGQFFILSDVEYKQRPIRGTLKGTQYFRGVRIKEGIAPVAKSLGSWCYSAPDGASEIVHRPSFPELVNKGNRKE